MICLCLLYVFCTLEPLARARLGLDTKMKAKRGAQMAVLCESSGMRKHSLLYAVQCRGCAIRTPDREVSLSETTSMSTTTAQAARDQDAGTATDATETDSPTCAKVCGPYGLKL